MGEQAAVYATAWAAMLLWWAGAMGSRAAWSAGAAAMAVHQATALHVAHGWSHATAYEHTARTGGVGWGVYVNYLFLLVWAADAAWMGVSPAGHARRPRWVRRAVHGFLGFVAFNATVVFGGWAARAVFGGLFAALVVRLVSGRAGGPTRDAVGVPANPSTPPRR